MKFNSDIPKRILHRIGQVRDLIVLVFQIQFSVISAMFLGLFRGRGFASLKVLYQEFERSQTAFHKAFMERVGPTGDLEGPALERLKNRVTGLHFLLPGTDQFRYSILIPVYKPAPDYFKKALKSALDQSAPNLEILIGFDGPQPAAIAEVVEGLKINHPRGKGTIKVFEFDREEEGGGISRTTNALASKATGNFLVLMDHDDWMRPDLLFRYEQTLRLSSASEKTVLYCDEFKIDEKGVAIKGSFIRKPERPVFPYVFINFICHCLMVPRDLWHAVGGLRPECDGAQDFDLCLRLDLQGAKFQNVPCFLYAWRSHSKSTAKSLVAKDYAASAGIRALQEYVARKRLDWEIIEGFKPTLYRARPRGDFHAKVVAIVPFKDERSLTMKAVRSLKDQLGVNLSITAVDNRSEDLSISSDLKSMGVEVLRVEEPFNFSRLNNLAVRTSLNAKESEVLLFMNNDVELEPDAVREMLGWVFQPLIGMVGCRLHYPDGKIQHGGVELWEEGPTKQMNFRHTEMHMPLDHTIVSRVARISDAVTAAACLIRKDIFLDVGGFDEVFYPIAFSDTDLARKIRQKGLYCFYTPFAAGIHAESISRGKNDIEDFEASRWLFVQTNEARKERDSFLNSSFGF